MFCSRAIRAHVAKREEWRTKFLLYSLYAWLLPLTITIMTYLTDVYQLLPHAFLPNMAVRYCFFYSKSADSRSCLSTASGVHFSPQVWWLVVALMRNCHCPKNVGFFILCIRKRLKLDTNSDQWYTFDQACA